MENDLEKRLNEPSIYILLALYLYPLSGYTITREVLRITGGRLEIKTGIMYPTLKNLMDEGYIKLLDIENAERNRKVYEITEKGKEIVEVEKRRLLTMLDEIDLATHGGPIL